VFRTKHIEEIVVEKMYAVYFLMRGENHLVGYSKRELNYSTNELVLMQAGWGYSKPDWYNKAKAIAEDWGWADGRVYTREVTIS
jgi:hypothetical protein